MNIDSVVTITAVGFSSKQFSGFKRNLFKDLKGSSRIINEDTDVLVIFVPKISVHSLKGRISRTIIVAGDNPDDVANLSAHVELNMKIRHIITQHHHQPGLTVDSNLRVT